MFENLKNQNCELLLSNEDFNNQLKKINTGSKSEISKNAELLKNLDNQKLEINKYLDEIKKLNEENDDKTSQINDLVKKINDT